VHLAPDVAVWVQAMAGDLVLCFWARHLTLAVLFSTKELMLQAKLQIDSVD